PWKYVAFWFGSIHLDSTSINATGVEDEHLDRTAGAARLRRQPEAGARTGAARRTPPSARCGRPAAISQRRRPRRAGLDPPPRDPGGRWRVETRPTGSGCFRGPAYSAGFTKRRVMRSLSPIRAYLSASASS